MLIVSNSSGTIQRFLNDYNAERFLKDSIRSILNQTFTDFRLIIVDDGSTDKSIEIIKSFNDSRIELIQDGYNKGLPYRLNQIAKLTKTKYLARMDADDIMHIDRIQFQFDILESNPEIDVLGTNTYSIDDKNQIQGIRLPYEEKLILSFVKGFVHPTILGKTQWFVNNPYDEKAIRVEDGELWFRTKNFSCFKAINKPLLFYREFGGAYYQKYQKGIKSMFYVSLKYYKENKNIKMFKWMYKTVLHIIKSFVYYIYFLLKSEKKLIEKRSLSLSISSNIKAVLSLKKALTK